MHVYTRLCSSDIEKSYLIPFFLQHIQFQYSYGSFFFVFFLSLFLITCTWSWWGRESIKKTIRQTYSSNQRSGLQSKIKKKKKKKKKLAKPKTEQVQRPTEKRHRSRVPTRSEPYICLYNELTTSSLLLQQYTIKIINKKQFFGFFYNPPKHAHIFIWFLFEFMVVC